VQAGAVNAFVLTGTKDAPPPPPAPSLPTDEEAHVNLAAVGVRDVGGDAIQFAITQYERRPTPEMPALFLIAIDANNDGVFDYTIFNNDLTGFNPVDGRNAVFVGPVSGPTQAVNFTDVDYGSANVFMTVPLADIGLKPGQTFGFAVEAFDHSFTGNLESFIAGMTYTVGQPAYVVAGPSPTIVPAGSADTPVTISKAPNAGPSTPKGVLLTYRINAGAESAAVALSG
jgi:hypothetical protein